MVPSDDLEAVWAYSIPSTSTKDRTKDPASPATTADGPSFFILLSLLLFPSPFQVGPSPRLRPLHSRCSGGVFSISPFSPQVSRCAAERQVNGGQGNRLEPGLETNTAALAQKA